VTDRGDRPAPPAGASPSATRRATPSATPDELGDPSGYQRHLVGLVGDDDPATVQSIATAAWTALVAEAVDDRLRARPATGEWSALECLGHAVDAEVVMSGRYRWALAEDDPELPGYDQDRWVDGLRHGTDDPRALLRLFGALREANLALWASASDDQRERTVRHRERGPESLRLMFTMLAGHDRFHLAQARRALESVAASR
jgi:hypothetical protein